MEKTWNNKAWFLVLPVLVLVAFSAVIPLMTVVNYSVQDTFGNNEFFWAGTDWFVQTLESDRFWAADWPWQFLRRMLRLRHQRSEQGMGSRARS